MDDRISLHKLTVFELVVELGGVSRAADQLFVSQPVVTMHIRTLEEQLGTKLFVRAKRGMQLTEAGEATHRWASAVLRQSRLISRELEGATDGSAGSIAIVTSLSLGCYVLPPVLARFRRDRPGIYIRLAIRDPTRALDEVEQGESDFAVVAVETTPAANGLLAEHVGNSEMVLIAPAAAELPASIAPQELSTLAFVEGPSRERLDRQLARLGIHERNIVMELGHPEAVKLAVSDGLGVAFLARSAVTRELESGRFREIRIDELHVGFDIYVAFRPDAGVSQAQRDLVDAIRAHFCGADRQMRDPAGIRA